MFDDSDDDLGLEDENCCYACLGKEDWKVDEAWIGCSNNKCNKWFHKTCIAEDVVNMTAEQLKKYQ